MQTSNPDYRLHSLLLSNVPHRRGAGSRLYEPYAFSPNNLLTIVTWGRKPLYIYLTKEERNKLYAAKFPDNPGLEVQRDIFIFQCFIGCRVGDMMKMIRLAGIDRVVTTLSTLTREEEKHPIWEVASSHMARRVLVGNLYKETTMKLE